MADRDFLVKVTKTLMDEGKLIEAGFAGYRLQVMSPKAPKEQIGECKLAFFAGALHLYQSIMSGMDPGTQETPDDLRRMALIDAELTKFAQDYEFEHVTKPKGQA